MKVLLSKALMAADREYIAARLEPGIDIVDPPEWNEAGVLKALPEANVVMGGLLSEAVLAAGQHVAFWQIPWTGVDTLNFELLERTNATVCNSHSNAGIVAEHAIALMLAIGKKLPYHDREMREGRWNRVSKDGNDVSPFSRTIAGTRAVILGYGAIGQGIARRLQGFDVTTEVVNTSGILPDGGGNGVSRAWKTSDLNQAVSGVDWLFVALPLTDATRNLVDVSIVNSMGSSANLINISRGAIVDETALFDALASNAIEGAGIDTWYSYPTPSEPVRAPSQNHSFESLQNVVMSPHRAGYATGGFPHLDDAIENLNRALAGRTLINVVSDGKGY